MQRGIVVAVPFSGVSACERFEMDCWGYSATSATEFEIPERVRNAFAGRTYLNQTELADALEMNIKSVARHMDEGKLKYIEVGTGKIRPRRKSTFSQVCAFLVKQSRDGSACSNQKAPGKLWSLPPAWFADLLLAAPVQGSRVWWIDGRN